MANYQPFLISQFKTGLFNYLQPWIAPTDAFEPLENAYVYRGIVQKRQGISPLGACIPLTDVPIGTGDGGDVYTGTLDSIPVTRGTFVPTDGVETFHDESLLLDGTLTGDQGGEGFIDYSTGAWELNFNTAVGVATPITASWCVVNGRLGYQDHLDTGDGATSMYSGQLLYNQSLTLNPILGGSFSATDGVETFTDNGDETLTGDMGGTGTIDYVTGDWTLNFNANVGLDDNIFATYRPNLASGGRPIMGLKQWTDDSTGETTLIALDTRRASVFNPSTQVFDPLTGVSQQIGTGDGTTVTFAVDMNWDAVGGYTNVITPFTVTVTDGVETLTDNGAGILGGDGSGTINYTNSAISVTFNTAPLAGAEVITTFTLAGDYFTGGTSNFFNASGWLSILYLTNNADPITAFDGTDLSRPPFSITLAAYENFENNIGRCIDVDVYKNRFLVQRPTLVTSANSSEVGLQAQSIRYSAINVPTNLAADVAGNGGELSAPTDDVLQTSEFLRDQLVVYFTNSVWLFRFTGSSFDPFRFDKLTVTKSTNAPYGSVAYDERTTSMGSKGLIACDGVNVQRYDVSVIDLFLQIKQQRFQQCFAQRFDNLNQTWMLYPNASASPNSFSEILSNAAIVYNFAENSWSTYDIRLSCLGLFHQTVDAIWNDFAPGAKYFDQVPNWEAADFTWDAYLVQDQAPMLLGGGQEGIVYVLNDRFSATDNGTPIKALLKSTQWNPFGQTGQKVQFGYIDIYYKKNPQCELTLYFYLDNGTSPSNVQTLDLDGPTDDEKNFKRIYMNGTGQFLRMAIESSSQAKFEILGMVLWARPAGRWTH